MTATSRRIARIAGPTAIALAATESVNMHIFAAQTAPVVYLNGTLLFVGGVAIVQAHNRWGWGWPLLVTLTGWGVMALGLMRMIAPDAAQASEGPATDVIFVALLALGASLSFLGYRRADPPREGAAVGPGLGGLAALSPAMARTKQSPEFEIVVGGEPYVWRLHRQPQWSSDTNEWRGMALAVRHQEGQREAVLEFPPGRQRKFGTPLLQPSQIAPELVAKAIASAIAAGWEPLSRGKTVAIVVDATGG